MKRAGFLLVVGLIVGAGVRLTYWFVSDSYDASVVERPGSVGPASTSVAPSVLATEVFESSHRAHIEAAGLNSVSAIESRISEAAARLELTEADAEIEAMLLRLAELDPYRAVALAEQLMLDDGFLARLFKTWADTDPDLALAALGQMRPSMTQRTVALSLLDVFGLDVDGVERIAASFDPDQANNFFVDALGRLAVRDLAGAMEAANSELVPGGVQTLARERIAEVMARVDPEATFEQSRTIEATWARRRYLNRLFDTWAKVDPDAVLGFLETAELPQLELGPLSFRALAVSSPERLLSVAEIFSPGTRAYAQQAVVQALAELDPAVAYQRVSRLPPSGNVDQFVASIADRYARQDPDAALAWARSLDPRSSVARNRVLQTIATTDPLRAVDEVVNEITDPVAALSSAMPSLASVLADPLSAGSPELAGVADILASHSDPRVRGQLDQLLNLWPRSDPRGALDWALGNVSELTPGSVGNLGTSIGRVDPALARQTLQRLPADLRSEWVTSAAGGMAQNDFVDTLDWLSPLSREPFYEDALVMASTLGAINVPEAVATLIDDRPSLADRLAPQVATSWGAADPAAAERWVLDLPPGQVRERSLQSLISGMASRGEFNRDLLAQFTTDAGRQQAVLTALPSLGRRDPRLGQQLIDDYISDPEQRAVAESLMQQGNFLVPDILIPLN